MWGGWDPQAALRLLSDAREDQPGQGALGTEKNRTTDWHWIHPHPKCYCWGGGGGHKNLSPGLKGLGHVAGDTDTSSPIPPSPAVVGGEHSPAPSAGPTLTGVQGEVALVRGRGGRCQGRGLGVAQQVLDGAQLEAGIRQQHRGRTLGPAKGQRPQTADNPPCTPSHTSIPSWCRLSLGERAHMQPKSSSHPPPPLPPRLRGSGIDVVLQHLLRLQPSGRCLSLGCCRAAEAASAAFGHSTSGEMLCRASHQGLGPSCTKGTAQRALRASRSPYKVGRRSRGCPWLQWGQSGRKKVTLMSVSIGYQCRGLVTALGKEQPFSTG